MNWGSLENFLHMGGYGFYVWGSYGVTALVLALELVLLRSRRRAALQEVATRAANASLNKGAA